MTTRALGLILAILTAATACRTATIYNATNVPLTSTSATPATIDDVTQGIMAAGLSKGWTMEAVRPGEIVARLTVKQHVAEVTVSYDTSRFSITYKRSRNLLHSGDEIHRRYNSWVKHLEDAIQDEMKRRATAGAGLGPDGLSATNLDETCSPRSIITWS